MPVVEGWSPVGCHILLLHKRGKKYIYIYILVHHAEEWCNTIEKNHFISLTAR